MSGGSTRQRSLGMIAGMKSHFRSQAASRLVTTGLVVCSFLSAIVLPRHARAQGTQAGEAPAAAQVRAGDAFMLSGQYREAAQQYEAGYALDPDVVILERLAEAYRRAGDPNRAAEIDARIAAARGQAPPAAYAPPAYVAPSPLPTAPVYTYHRPQQKAGQGLINAGVGLLVAGWAMGIVGGAITMGATYATNASSSWYGAGGMLFIPIVGPFATSAYHSEIYWSAPWAVIDGGMQLAGLALVIAGACVRASARSHPQRANSAASAKPLPFTLAPYSNREGAGLLLRATF